MTTETLNFQAEVSRLLDIVAHSLYSHREIFLRELISNASDACDKLRYQALTQADLMAGDPDFRISLAADADAKTLTIADNGIGMNREDLIENLGTIARSGTENFVKALEAENKDGVNLIGRFGVGFYSAFMVADTVTVNARKAGETAGWSWTSDGKGAFTIEEVGKPGRGTEIILHLKDDALEFAEMHRLEHIVRTYSDHIAVPIVTTEAPEEEGAEPESRTLNTASALWTREKKDITEEQYTEFYHHVGHAFDEPWLTLHNKNEGVVTYTNLLFIPTNRPFDLFHPDRKTNAKLYVKRVFITDDCEDLLPSYLRFVKGIVDAEDLTLNISRETLQNSPVLAKIKRGLTKRILGELKKKSEKDPEAYATFWEAFGAVIKEGLYEDFDNREALLPLFRAHSTEATGLTTLTDYASRMKEGQEAIYYIVGDALETLRKSPQIEGFKAKGVEVLLLTDPVDEFWVSTVGEVDGKRLMSVTRGGADLDKINAGTETETEPKEPEAVADADALVAALKLALGEAVKDVRRSARLTDSAVCLVADEGDMDIHLQRMLKAHGQLDKAQPRVLEFNPKHPLIKRLASLAESDGSGEAMADAAHLLLDQARIIEGEVPADPVGFASRLSRVMERGF
ncbi:MAG: molecular chaperone HtpG [Magnetospiraceae bacterium]